MKDLAIGRRGLNRGGCAVLLGMALLWGAQSVKAAQDPEEGTPITLKIGRTLQAADYNTETYKPHLQPANNANGPKVRELAKANASKGSKNSQGGQPQISFYPGD